MVGQEWYVKGAEKKRFLKDHVGINIRSVWDDAGTNDQASQLLRDIMRTEKPYSNPKPPKLIQKVISYSSIDGITLDFFAGSGTTAMPS
jgi:DNA modification methylase